MFDMFDGRLTQAFNTFPQHCQQCNCTFKFLVRNMSEAGGDTFKSPVMKSEQQQWSTHESGWKTNQPWRGAGSWNDRKRGHSKASTGEDWQSIHSDDSSHIGWTWNDSKKHSWQSGSKGKGKTAWWKTDPPQSGTQGDHIMAVMSPGSSSSPMDCSPKEYSSPPSSAQVAEVFHRLLQVEQDQLIALADPEKRCLNMTMVLGARRDGVSLPEFLECNPFRSVPLRLLTRFPENEMAVVQYWAENKGLLCEIAETFQKGPRIKKQKVAMYANQMYVSIKPTESELAEFANA